MNTLAKLRRLLTAVKWRRSVPRDRFGPSTVQEAGDRTIPLTAPAGVAAAGEITFTPSFAPFKPVRKNAEWVEKKQQQEWEEFGCVLTPDTYPHGYGVGRDADGNLTLQFKERFRSVTEVEWATACDRLGLQWEYEPLKFDMGPKYFSYTPDFRVPELAAPGPGRALYVEIKSFGEDMDLTKYVRFTQWYNCDLLVLAHHEGSAGTEDIDVLQPKNKRYFLILKCAQCNSYDWFPCDELPTDGYICRQNIPSALYILSQNMPYALANKFPFGYRLAADGTFWLAAEEEPPPFAVLPTSA